MGVIVYITQVNFFLIKKIFKKKSWFFLYILNFQISIIYLWLTKKGQNSLIIYPLRSVMWFPSPWPWLTGDAMPILGLDIRSLEALVWSSYTLSPQVRSLIVLRLPHYGRTQSAHRGITAGREGWGERAKGEQFSLSISLAPSHLSYPSWGLRHCRTETNGLHCVPSKFRTSKE